MTELLVFDPALCCSTGVCGPEVDPELVRFAADLDWLKSQGASVRRYNLAQEAGAFAQHPLVRQTLQQESTECLPLLLLDGRIISKARYPTRDELAGWAGLTGAQGRLLTEEVEALIALAAVVASNSEHCFWEQHERAQQLGIGTEDLRRTAEIAVGVKGVAARQVREAAEEAFREATAPVRREAADGRGAGDACCAPSMVTLGGARAGSSGCC